MIGRNLTNRRPVTLLPVTSLGSKTRKLGAFGSYFTVQKPEYKEISLSLHSLKRVWFPSMLTEEKKS